VFIRTGRIDQRDPHDGLPAEPLMIFMKWLAREAREQTPWAQRHLNHQAVTWQFDTAEGLKYAVQYDAASDFTGVPTEVVHMRLGTSGDAASDSATIVFSQDEGLHGDGALEFQESLTRHLRARIEGAR
jgi:hypothetical protein